MTLHLPRLAALLALSATPALAEAPKVVVDIAPVHSLLTQVMEGVATPELLLGQDANPHSVTLRPSQARMLADADLVVWVGPGLEPWMTDAVKGLATGDQIVLLENPATVLRPIDGADEHDHEAEGDDHDHEAEAPVDEDHEGEDHDEHDHGSVDPHLWLTPANGQAWLGVFAEELAARDPENAEAYRANATAAQARLDEVATGIKAELAPYAGAEIVTFHASFGYFADYFGLEVIGSVRPGDASTPSAAAVAALRDLVAEHGIQCAFGEPAFDPALLEAIASETGLRVGVLDPTGALQEPGPGHYAATLQAAGDAIAACLSAE